MALTLSSADLARLAEASRVLASPLAYDTVDDWRRAAMQAVAAAARAESSCLVLGSQPRAALGWHLDPDGEDALDAILGPVSRREGPSGNVMLDEIVAYTRRERPPAWDLYAADRALGSTGDTWRSAWYHDFLLRYGAADMTAFFVSRPAVDVAFTVHNFHRPPAPGASVPLLALLHPALDAGLDALERLGAHRAALDATGAAAAFVDADGRETHRTPALAALLAADPDGRIVADALAQAARTAQAPGAFAAPALSVRTRQSAYVVRTTRLSPASASGGVGFALTVAAATPEPLSAAVLHQRFGLTPREADVARLVARGQTNAAVAATLSVSRHTVRHHLEAAAGKLGLSGQGRTAVAALLAGLAASGQS